MLPSTVAWSENMYSYIPPVQPSFVNQNDTEKLPKAIDCNRHHRQTDTKRQDTTDTTDTTDRQTDRQAPQTGRQAGMQAGRQAGRQAG
eukprot:COSAG06_NODE_5496_length_3442_cov_3.881544_4_plen_87_part_01